MLHYLWDRRVFHENRTGRIHAPRLSVGSVTMNGTAVGWGLIPIEHSIVTQHMRDFQPVVTEQTLATLGLRRSMGRELPPALYRLVIAEIG